MRVLVVRVGAMGDVLHALPAVSALRRRHPDWQLGWVIEPRWQPLLTDAAGLSPNGLLDQVHQAQTALWKHAPFSRATAASLLALRRELRATRYDLSLDLQGTLRSSALGWLSGARRRIGAAHPREQAATSFYTTRVVRRARHVIDQACELASAAAGRWPAEHLAPEPFRLPVDPAAEEWFHKTVNQAGSPAAEDFAFIVPQAGWGAKQWSAGCFAELAHRLRQAGIRVLVNAVSAADPLARQVAEAGGGEAIACDVAQLIALTRRARVAIGGDTGPIHLAAALGRPVVALFGPTDPERNGPGAFPGAQVTVLRDARSVTSHKRRTETEAGLARISVSEVLDEVLALTHVPVTASDGAGGVHVLG